MTFHIQGVSGPDVSMYQDAPTTPQQINFEKMRGAGAQFVIIRVGQNAWVDPDFQWNYIEAKKAGLPRGAYFYYDSRVTPESQAALFLSLVDGNYPELGIWLDLEEKYNGAYRGWANWKRCLDILKARAPRVGIYTGPSYWKENRPLGATYLNYFKSFPLWIANYEVLQPIIPAPWAPDECVFWQYGTPSIGPEYGVESIEIDMNYFNGDAAAFASYFGLGSAVLPPVVIPPGEQMATSYKVNTAKLQIRNGPGLSYSDIGDLFMGDIIQVAETLGGWHRFTHILRAGNLVSIPEINSYCYAAYTVATAPPVVEPPAEITPPSRVLLIWEDAAGNVTKQAEYLPE
jgi:lysozyme